MSMYSPAIQDTETQIVGSREFFGKVYNRQNVYIYQGVLTATGTPIEVFQGNNNFTGATGAVIRRIAAGDAATALSLTSVSYQYALITAAGSVTGFRVVAATNTAGTVASGGTTGGITELTAGTPTTIAVTNAQDNTNKTINFLVNAPAAAVLYYQIVATVVHTDSRLLYNGI